MIKEEIMKFFTWYYRNQYMYVVPNIGTEYFIDENGVRYEGEDIYRKFKDDHKVNFEPL